MKWKGKKTAAGSGKQVRKKTSRRHLLGNAEDDLDTAVLPSAFRRVVGCGEATSTLRIERQDAVSRRKPGTQVVVNDAGACACQGLVGTVGADVIGAADDGNAVGMARENNGLIEHSFVGCRETGAAGIEMNGEACGLIFGGRGSGLGLNGRAGQSCFAGHLSRCVIGCRHGGGLGPRYRQCFAGNGRTCRLGAKRKRGIPSEIELREFLERGALAHASGADTFIM